MKIDSSTVNFAASHSASARSEVHETLHAWVGDKRPDFEGNSSRGAAGAGTVVSISAAAEAAFRAELREMARNAAAAPTPPAAPDGANAVKDAVDSADNDPVLNLIRLVLEAMTGHKIKILSSSDFQVEAGPAPAAPPQQGEQQAAPQRAGFGIEYDRHEVSVQTEQTAFQASGVVRTSDGKEINFSVSLAMSSSVTQESSVSFRAGDGVKKDPLVINFGGTAAQLQSQRFSFDLDADGKAEAVPMLAGNSGYLALDMDGNGKIDSGAELFGASSGNGFADLAKYDGDGNGWIDESDRMFKQLQVWMPDASGAGALVSLADKGVGALFLGQQSTPFSLKDSAGTELGAVRASGAYLTEDGKAGTLQQIDLVV